jgi:hypothetical protein
MIRRLLALIFGCVLIVLLFLIGKNSVDSPTTASVLWFGLASALLAPIGLGLLGYAIMGSDSDQISRLTKVTEIEQLINKAETEEEKLKHLQDERKILDSIIRFEVERRTLEARKKALENIAEQTLKELEIIDQQLIELGSKVEQGVVGEQIKKLRERIDAVANDDVVFKFRTKQYIFRKKLITNLPFYGDSVFYSLRLMASLNSEINRVLMNKKNGNAA